MNRIHRALALCCALAIAPVAASSPPVDQALAEYQRKGAASFDTDAGRQMWQRQVVGPKGTRRSCTTCHGTDLKRSGRHVRTDEPIEPMAPSVNPQRLSDRRKIEKWLLRNCKWTLGRECTWQEKGDILSYLRRQ